jgi:hypothetical protein
MASVGGVASIATSVASATAVAPALVNSPDPMRAYRACLHCRSRKTKCTLDMNGGRPVSIDIPTVSYYATAVRVLL